MLIINLRSYSRSKGAKNLRKDDQDIVSSYDGASASDDADLDSGLDYLERFVEAGDFKLDREPSYTLTPPASAATTPQHAAVNCPPQQDDLLHSEQAFFKNFYCCGMVLHDMHELIRHYELHHVHLDESTGDAYDFDYDVNGYGVGVGVGACDGLVDQDDQFLFRRGRSRGHNDGDYAIDDYSYTAFEDSYIVKNENKKRGIEHEYLVRRVGDIEDDLGASVLEWISQELTKGGKRVKMDSVIEWKKNQSEDEGDANCDGNSSVGQSGGNDNNCDGSREDSAGNEKNEKSSHRKRENQFSFYDEQGNKIEKPYKCSYPGCDKAYKNPNGLKYHNIHGHNDGEDDLDMAVRMMKPYVCSFDNCMKRYKNLNGLKYHIEKSHGADRTKANSIASSIVKKTNAEFGIQSRSVPNSVLLAAMKEQTVSVDDDQHYPGSVMPSGLNYPPMDPFDTDINLIAPFDQELEMAKLQSILNHPNPKPQASKPAMNVTPQGTIDITSEAYRQAIESGQFMEITQNGQKFLAINPLFANAMMLKNNSNC